MMTMYNQFKNNDNYRLLRLIAIIAGAIFAFGIAAETIHSNTKEIEANTFMAQSNQGDIREIKTDITWIRGSVDRIESKLNTKE